LTIGNPPEDCLLVNCLFSVEYSTIKLDPPPYTIVTASDLALQSEVYDAIDRIMNGTLTTLQGVIDGSYSVGDTLKNLSKQLDTLNFNVSQILPYQNFSAQRAAVDAEINGISAMSVDNWNLDGGCTGIFSSITCFFQQIASTIVTILIIVACVIGGYIVCFKLGVAKILTKKLFGGSKK